MGVVGSAGTSAGVRWSYQSIDEPNRLERRAIGGDSPVGEGDGLQAGIPSSARPVKPGVKQRGPPRKAKYFLVTDSEK